VFPVRRRCEDVVCLIQGLVSRVDGVGLTIHSSQPGCSKGTRP